MEGDGVRRRDIGWLACGGPDAAYFLLTVTTIATMMAMMMIMMTPGFSQYTATDRKDEDRLTDEEAPPLLPASATGLLDRTTNLGVCLNNVFVDLFTLGLDVLNKRLLLLHDLVEVLE